MSAPSLVDQMTAAARGGQTAAPDTAGGGSLVDQFTRGTHPSQASTVLPPLTLPTAPPHHGTFGGNLLHDVSGAITGLATQPVHLAENLATHPVATVEHAPHDIKKFAKGTVASEVHTWGPFVNYYKHYGYYLAALAKGDHATAVKEHATAEKFNRQFNEQFHAHPLQPVIDLATVLTGGAGRVAALSHVPEDATLGQIAKTAALKGQRIGAPKVLHVAAGADSTVPVRTLPRSAYRAGRMEFTHNLLTSPRISLDKPLVGQYARAARALKSDPAQLRMRLMNTPEYANYLRRFGKLGKWERAAVQMLAKLSTTGNLDRHIGNLRRNSDTALADAEAKVKAATTPAQKKLAARRFNVAQAEKKTSEQQAALLSNPKLRAAYDNPDGKVTAALEAARALSGKREEILGTLGENTDALQQSVFKHIQVTHGGQVTEDGIVGGGTPEEHAAAIEAAGRPQPFYMPDVLDEGTAAVKARKGAATGSPTGLLPAQSDVRAWQNVLFKTGQLSLHPDVLSPSYLRAVTRAYGQDLYEHVREIATPVEHSQGLPPGYRWVREKRGEHIPYTESHGAEHFANTDREFPEIHDEIGDMFGDDNLPAGEIATDEAGMRLAVPQKIADELRVQQRAVRGNTKRIWDNSTQVWRALVLNLRVPWLINNIVGNHLLAAVRFAGVPGLKAYVGALREVKGMKAVRELMNLPETRSHLSDEALREIFPEQARPGTFIGTQMPTNAASKVPVAVQKATKYPRAVIGALPKMDRATEGFLRRAGIETELRRSPEFNRVLKAMPKETRSFDAAARKLAEGKPEITHAVSREVNDALGNFNSLTYAEQNAIRDLVPFYAWYREITRIALKLPLDEPLRANILLRLGQAGGTQPGLPSYLQGDVPVGKLNPDGTKMLLALRGMNPYTTPIDLARAISLIWSPKRAAGRSAEGLVSPFVALAATVIDKAANGDTNAKSALDAFYSDFLRGLPEPAILINKQSNLYPGRTRTDLFEQFLGSPVRHVDPAVAQQYADEGN